MNFKILLILMIIPSFSYSQYLDVNVSGRVEQDITIKVIDYTSIIDQSMKIQNNINDAVVYSMANNNWDLYYAKRNERKLEKMNSKNSKINAFYDENSLVNQWIIALREKLVAQNNDSKKIEAAIQILRDENNLIFDKYFKKKNLPEFYRESNVLKNKILDFKLDQ